MNNDASRLHLHRTHSQEVATNQHSRRQEQAREFSTVEEMIRHDREQTEAPDQLAARLNETAAAEPKPGRSLWQRLFGP